MNNNNSTTNGNNNGNNNGNVDAHPHHALIMSMQQAMTSKMNEVVGTYETRAEYLALEPQFRAIETLIGKYVSAFTAASLGKSAEQAEGMELKARNKFQAQLDG